MKSTHPIKPTETHHNTSISAKLIYITYKKHVLGLILRPGTKIVNCHEGLSNLVELSGIIDFSKRHHFHRFSDFPDFLSLI